MKTEITHISEVQPRSLVDIVESINALTPIQMGLLREKVFDHYFNQLKINISNTHEDKYMTAFLCEVEIIDDYEGKLLLEEKYDADALQKAADSEYEDHLKDDA